MPKKKPTKVYRYDGQGIWTSPDSGYASFSDYELGSFLGGGAAGVVYEAECFKTKRVSTCARGDGEGGGKVRVLFLRFSGRMEECLNTRHKTQNTRG